MYTGISTPGIVIPQNHSTWRRFSADLLNDANVLLPKVAQEQRGIWLEVCKSGLILWGVLVMHVANNDQLY